MTPRLRRLVRFLAHRGIPRRTRLELLLLEVQRRLRPRPVYSVRLGHGAVPLTHDDFAIDWYSLEWVLVDEAYAMDYTGAVVLDIGAHKGYFSAYAVAGGARAVIAYEPEAQNFELLEQCAASYGSQGTEWRLRRAAVGAEHGEAELHVSSASWGHALHPPDSSAPYEVGVQRVPVDAMTAALAEAEELAGESAPLVVKVNTEGEECSIFLGTPPAAWRSVTDVFVEVHSWAPCTADELAAHLASAGLTKVPSADPHVLRLHRSGDARSDPRSAPT